MAGGAAPGSAPAAWAGAPVSRHPRGIHGSIWLLLRRITVARVAPTTGRCAQSVLGRCRRRCPWQEPGGGRERGERGEGRLHIAASLTHFAMFRRLRKRLRLGVRI